ncbi:MAG: hypothetical protein ACT4QA_20685 [Panacagrimonas sp.]
MNTTFLTPEEVAKVESIVASYGLSGFDASVRLWGRGKAIQVSGKLDRLELSCLLAIARYLNVGSDVVSDIDASSAPAPGTSLRVADAA